MAYDENRQQTASEKWNMRTANWDVYKASDAWKELPVDTETRNDNLIKDMYNRVTTAAREAIPQTQYSKFYPRPWR